MSIFFRYAKPQLNKLDLEALGLNRLDISPSPSLGSTAIAAAHGGLEPATAAAAWRLLEAGDTLCIGQVESLGMRQLMRRARELRDQHGSSVAVLSRVEDLAQFLALWRPGAWGKQREQAYLDARFAGSVPASSTRPWRRCWRAPMGNCSTSTSCYL